MTNELDFDSYIRAGEPEKSEKSRAWAAAIGLQAVDGLKPSAYLYDVARRNIEGDITMEQAGRLVDAYYESKTVRADDGARTEEADKVSARIAQILSEKSFNFSPSYYIAIHKRLFEGVYKFAGMLRDYDITKKEWVLDGDTVLYGSAFELKAALDYDFDLERNFSYKNLSQEDVLHHLAQFVAHVWQIHAFGEGNTRTTAVFFIKYVRSLGYDATNDMFMEHSWYFRNALVRANYRNLDKDILETTDYLELFLRNLLFKERNELKNRYMHIRADEIFELQKSSDKTLENSDKSSDKMLESSEEIEKGSDKTLESSDKIEKGSDKMAESSEEIEKSSDKILELVQNDATLSAQKIAELLGISSRAVEKQLAALKEKGKLQRIGSKKGGYWKVIV